MMRKIFLSIFIFLLTVTSVYGYEKPEIISRETWGANPEYTYRDSAEWKKILASWAAAEKKEPTSYQLFLREKNKEAESILANEYPEQIAVTSTINYTKGRPLLWDIQYPEDIRAIVVHHTETTNGDSLNTIRSIYKYHALTRAWGDIGYNYLIGMDGKVYEGRQGGETAVGAHVKWNNIGTIGISVMGSYDDENITPAQRKALKNLLGYLVEKYDIDLSEKVAFHAECFDERKCEKALKTEYLPPIVGHRDAGNTTCPGDKLYSEMIEIRQELTKEQLVGAYDFQAYFKLLSKIPDEKLLEALKNAEKLLDKKYNPKIAELKIIILEYFSEKYKTTSTSSSTDTNIKVKLSYPDETSISLFDGLSTHTVEVQNDMLSYNGKNQKYLRFAPKLGEIMTITSWEHYPDWDKQKRYNDNQFRGAILLMIEDGKLVVVNELALENYLKGLGEVSNNELEEKAKSIIIAARSYALWYVTEARKFPGKIYDASDDPEVFQRYLGYGLEKRSPMLNRIVEDTKGQVLSYNGALIKPWYFNSSNGFTLSFYDWCRKNTKNTDSYCKNTQKENPFLVTREDPGSVGKNFYGHGVGLSGNGAHYFALRGWSADMILRYFYPGVEIE